MKTDQGLRKLDSPRLDREVHRILDPAVKPRDVGFWCFSKFFCVSPTDIKIGSKFSHGWAAISFFILCYLIITTSILIAAPRELIINNNCDFDVMWALKGSPIKSYNYKNSGKFDIVYCDDSANFGDSCFDGKGYCGQKLGDQKIQCYFKYPTIISKADSSKPDYYIPAGKFGKYQINLINRYDLIDGASVPVTQYTFNIAPQRLCEIVKEDGINKYKCKSGPCGHRLYNGTQYVVKDSIKRSISGLPKNGSIPNGACSPDKGVLSAISQAEITMNDGGNDFYDISIINGINIPVSVKPKPKTKISSSTGVQPQFYCKATGEAPSFDSKNLKGCNWSFNPPTEYNGKRIYKHIFTVIDNHINQTKCLDDNDCKSVGGLCGLKWPEDYINYKNNADGKNGYCGIPIAYWTLSGIAPEVFAYTEQTQGDHGGQYSDLNKLFDINSKFTVKLSDGSGAESFSNNKLFMCDTVVRGAGYKYLDSCYNYNIKDDASGINPSTACCGCIDWPGVPTDENHLCLTSANPNASLPPLCSDNPGLQPPNCRVKDNTKVSITNTEWLNKVKPLLAWLIDGCPDAYEYQYGDKHGTMQCSSKDNPQDPGNDMGYVVTFCPTGKGIFSSDSTTHNKTILIQDPKVNRLDNNNSYDISWGIYVSPQTDSDIINSNIKIVDSSGNQINQDTPDCTSLNCTTTNIQNLQPDSTYYYSISASVFSDGNKIDARTLKDDFKTEGGVGPTPIPIDGEVIEAFRFYDCRTAPLDASNKWNQCLTYAVPEPFGVINCSPGSAYPHIVSYSNQAIKVYSANHELIGQWNYTPINNGCFPIREFTNPYIHNNIAYYNNHGPVAFTFTEAPGWNCQFINTPEQGITQGKIVCQKQ